MESAAQLRHEMLPREPIRQWVLSVPFALVALEFLTLLVTHIPDKR